MECDCGFDCTDFSDAGTLVGDSGDIGDNGCDAPDPLAPEGSPPILLYRRILRLLQVHLRLLPLVECHSTGSAMTIFSLWSPKRLMVHVDVSDDDVIQ